MAANFPNSPNTNDTFTSNGVTFKWDGSAWKQPASPGVKGTKGDKGEKGEKGQKGDKGEKGQKGEVGLSGNAGGKGQKGEKGEKGEKGQKGDKGEKGQKGEVGAGGIKGQKGEKGEKGEKGQKGQDGNDATGTKGQKGEVGQKGQKGEDNSTKGQKGDDNSTKGEKGQKGQTGADNSTKGQKGQKGEVGPQGTGGTGGSKGDKGQKGEVGAQGNQGTGGSAGVKGEKGQKGEDNSTKGQKGEIGVTGSTGIPSGFIGIWSGAANAIPSGWYLCNGSNGTPDLRNRFIVGAGSGYSVGSTGGANTVTLSINEMPAHDHDTDLDGYKVFATGPNAMGFIGYGGPGGYPGGYVNMQNTGGGQAHENRPPFYALCYIIQYAQGGDAAKGQKGEEGTLKPASASGGGSLLTTNESYQNVVSVTITPSQSNSHMMVIATGTVGGEEGNNQNNTGTGTAQITRDTTQLGDEIVSSTGGVPRYSRFDQALIDTNNHGGSAVTYRIRLKKGGGNQAHAYLGGARSTNGSNSQGSARLLVLEILQ